MDIDWIDVLRLIVGLVAVAGLVLLVIMAWFWIVYRVRLARLKRRRWFS